MLDFLLEILGDLVGESIADRWRQWRARRLQRKGALFCALRVRKGDQPGLTRCWRHGKARLSPGAIEFVPKAPWARRSTIPVRAASWRKRQPRGREAWVVDPRSRVVEVTTGEATLEWAVPAEQVQWALAQVRQEVGDAVRTTG